MSCFKFMKISQPLSHVLPGESFPSGDWTRWLAPFWDGLGPIFSDALVCRQLVGISAVLRLKNGSLCDCRWFHSTIVYNTLLKKIKWISFLGHLPNFTAIYWFDWPMAFPRLQGSRRRSTWPLSWHCCPSGAHAVWPRCEGTAWAILIHEPNMVFQFRSSCDAPLKYVKTQIFLTQISERFTYEQLQQTSQVRLRGRHLQHIWNEVV